MGYTIWRKTQSDCLLARTGIILEQVSNVNKVNENILLSEYAGRMFSPFPESLLHKRFTTLFLVNKVPPPEAKKDWLLLHPPLR